MKTKAVLFDFDGVIADTEQGATKYLEKAFDKYHIQLTEDQRRSYIGTDGRKQTEEILKDAGVSVSVEEFFKERAKLGSYYENSPDLKPISGLEDFLKLLKRKDIKTGIVSSTNCRLIITALNRMHLIHYFDVIICGDMVEHKKPDPEGYLTAMQYVDAGPKECIILEDSPTGIKAAVNAKATVVGFKGSEIKQDTSQADLVWETYEEAIRWFRHADAHLNLAERDF